MNKKTTDGIQDENIASGNQNFEGNENEINETSPLEESMDELKAIITETKILNNTENKEKATKKIKKNIVKMKDKEKKDSEKKILKKEIIKKREKEKKKKKKLKSKLIKQKQKAKEKAKSKKKKSIKKKK